MKMFYKRLTLSVLVLLSASTLSGQRYLSRCFDGITLREGIQYSAAEDLHGDQVNLYFDLYAPACDTLQFRPLVITVFGGAFVAGSRDYVDMVAIADTLAHYGYVVASIDYRLMSVWDAVSETKFIREGYMAAQDVSAAVRFFKANGAEYGIDTSRIFLLGNSAGTIASLYNNFLEDDERPAETFNSPDLGGISSSGFPAYAGYSNKVTAIVAQWGGVTDLSIIDERNTTPICLIHGTEDRTVPYVEGECRYTALFTDIVLHGSYQIKQSMDELGVYCELHPFEGEPHCFYLDTWNNLIESKLKECLDIAIPFLARYTLSGTVIGEPAAETFAVCPNPAVARVTVFSGCPAADIRQLRMFNAEGRLVLSREMSGTAEIDVSDLPSGLYCICLQHGSRTAVRKLLVQ